MTRCVDCEIVARALRRRRFHDNIRWDADTAGRVHATSSQGPRSLCDAHTTVVEFLRLYRSPRISVYVAHPVRGDFERNLANARAWLRYLRNAPVAFLSHATGRPTQDRPLFSMPWAAAPDASDDLPENRGRLIADCRDAARMHDEVWFVGGRVTDGMREEAAQVNVTQDLTYLGFEPPPGYPVPE